MFPVMFACMLLRIFKLFSIFSEESLRLKAEISDEAGAMFDNSFVFLRQLKNGSFLGPVFVHVTGRSQN